VSGRPRGQGPGGGRHKTSGAQVSGSVRLCAYAHNAIVADLPAAPVASSSPASADTSGPASSLGNTIMRCESLVLAAARISDSRGAAEQFFIPGRGGKSYNTRKIILYNTRKIILYVRQLVPAIAAERIHGALQHWCRQAIAAPCPAAAARRESRLQETGSAAAAAAAATVAAVCSWQWHSAQQRQPEPGEVSRPRDQRI
jgi:hypothetical protein